MQGSKPLQTLFSRYKTLNVSKDNLKFSAAHFLIFDEHRAERLHGHNYQVSLSAQVDFEAYQGIGYGIDFSWIKNTLKASLDEWDERVLLPSRRDLRCETHENTMEVYFRDRFYAFPKNEVVVLGVANTSVEMLSELLCQKLWSDFHARGVVKLSIRVEETLGQSAESFVEA